MKDEQRLGLLKETLIVIFGLEEDTVHRVVRTIKSSTDSIDVRTPNIRSRIGPRAMNYLRNAIEIARHEGTEKHEKDKSVDKSKKSDISPSSRKQSSNKKKKRNESVTFTEFLLAETQIDVDLDDAQGSMQELRKAQRLNKSSPDRVNRDNLKQAKEEQRDAQQSAGTDPTANVRSRIAKKKIETSQLNRRLNSMKKAQPENDSTEGTM
ncbi:MAG: hypothetical protein DRQ46_10850 [Gammaproteobacteria bacterium]|nr:MAG: hypothetical protein DRQ46_10850 [Gammaproteobacteria bacterium]